jgi:hypothetical protein
VGCGLSVGSNCLFLSSYRTLRHAGHDEELTQDENIHSQSQPA